MPRAVLSILMIVFLLASVAFAKGKPLVNEAKLLKLSEVMKKAANAYPSVAASQKRIESIQNQRTGVLLDSLSLIGTLSNQRTDGRMTMSDSSFHTRQSMTTTSIGVQLMLSLSTWFQERGLAITQEMAESARTALQMQLATDAADAYGVFYNNDSRLLYLRYFRQSLEEIKKKYGKALSPVTQALLENKIAEFEAESTSVQLKKDMASADVENFWGEEPGSLDHFLNETSNGRSQDSQTWPGLDWQKIDQYFPVPADPETAFANSQHSPTLIQAHLSEKEAQNNWYLVASKGTPHLVFRIERTRNSTSISALDSKQTLSGNSVSVIATFEFGAGTFHNLNAADLLSEAAQLDRQATERQLRLGFKKLFRSLKDTQGQIKIIENSLKKTIPAFEKAHPKSEQSIIDYLDLVSSLNQGFAQISDQVSLLILNRVRIHGMMGTLLEEIDRLEGIGE